MFLRLRDQGVHNINLVTGSHFVRPIAEALDGLELGIPVVWNSSGYESVETLRRLEGLVQVYMPDFIKTSTGFGTGGATPEDVRLMKETVGDDVKVKAAGGIRDWASCKAMIEAGAERIGASAGRQILDEFRPE